MSDIDDFPHRGGPTAGKYTENRTFDKVNDAPRPPRKVVLTSEATGSKTRMVTKGRGVEYITTKKRVEDTTDYNFQGALVSLDGVMGFTRSVNGKIPATPTTDNDDILWAVGYVRDGKGAKLPKKLRHMKYQYHGNVDWRDTRPVLTRQVNEIVTWHGVGPSGRQGGIVYDLVKQTEYYNDNRYYVASGNAWGYEHFPYFNLEAAFPHNAIIYVDGLPQPPVALVDCVVLSSAIYIHATLGKQLRAIVVPLWGLTQPDLYGFRFPVINTVSLYEKPLLATNQEDWALVGTATIGNKNILQVPFFNSSGTEATGICSNIGLGYSGGGITRQTFTITFSASPSVSFAEASFGEVRRTPEIITYDEAGATMEDTFTRDTLAVDYVGNDLHKLIMQRIERHSRGWVSPETTSPGIMFYDTSAAAAWAAANPGNNSASCYAIFYNADTEEYMSGPTLISGIYHYHPFPASFSSGMSSGPFHTEQGGENGIIDSTEYISTNGLYVIASGTRFSRENAHIAYGYVASVSGPTVENGDIFTRYYTYTVRVYATKTVDEVLNETPIKTGDAIVGIDLRAKAFLCGNIDHATTDIDTGFYDSGSWTDGLLDGLALAELRSRTSLVFYSPLVFNPSYILSYGFAPPSILAFCTSHDEENPVVVATVVASATEYKTIMAARKGIIETDIKNLLHIPGEGKILTAAIFFKRRPRQVVEEIEVINE